MTLLIKDYCLSNLSTGRKKCVQKKSTYTIVFVLFFSFGTYSLEENACARLHEQDKEQAPFVLCSSNLLKYNAIDGNYTSFTHTYVLQVIANIDFAYQIFKTWPFNLTLIDAYLFVE